MHGTIIAGESFIEQLLAVLTLHSMLLLSLYSVSNIVAALTEFISVSY